jgi:hypothetical protein
MNSFGKYTLDEAWRQGGIPAVRKVFDALAAQDASEALGSLNDMRLGFPIFFILLDDMIRFKMTDSLRTRNRAALYICAQKIRRLQPYVPTRRPDDETLYGTLRWMLDTGIGWDGPSRQRDDYDSVIDYAAALVIGSYEDTEVLPEVAELIFRRNRQGHFVHDLIWSFFQAMNSDALEHVAGFLNSSYPADVSLAKKLLGIDADKKRYRMDSGQDTELSDHMEAQTVSSDRSRSGSFLEWLRDNKPYLYLTGEQLQMTSTPKHFDCDMEAKYLGKEISPKRRTPLIPLTEDEAECLNRYRTTNPADQGILAEYSHKLRRRDKREWQAWLSKQIAEQVFSARNETGSEAV